MVTLLKEGIFPSVPFHINETVLRNAAPVSEAHRHDFFEVFIIEEGVAHHRKNGALQLLAQDSVTFIFPDDEHSFSNGSREPLRFINLAFTEKIFCLALRSAAIKGDREKLKESVYLPHSVSKQLISRLFWLRNECDSFSPEAREAMLCSLLADILTSFTLGSRDFSSVPQWLKSACEEMRREENFSAGLPRFIALSGKTQEHLTRCMKKYFGASPSEFINELRLERAAHLLLSSEDSVFDIMLDCGFQNTSYFNKRFKEKYHMTPTKYRFGDFAILGKSTLH